MKKRVAIFGSTGLIGTTTLNIIRNNMDKFDVVTLVAGENVEGLVDQIIEFNPKHVYIKDKENYDRLNYYFKNVYDDIDIYYGENGIKEISKLDDYDIGVSALVGIAGLEPTYNMIVRGKTVLLANKEVLVTGGNFIMKAAEHYGAKLISIDSEHSAIMQCLNDEDDNKIDKVLLTASGGPFYDKEITDKITVKDALSHPTWSMGKKVTIDSSTMMNKGFEVIEASLLFGVSPSDIQVVVHRQSLVHSMVQFKDGTIMANIGPSSMEIPISYALYECKRIPNNIEKLDLFKIHSLTFEKPDLNKFKCLKYALDAIRSGHSYQVSLNAFDEVAVSSFLSGEIKYTDIARIIEYGLSSHNSIKINSVNDIVMLDCQEKLKAHQYVKKIK